ncbi:MAG: hypothetical protein FWH11_08315 [Micrococcales bacterium]|nr:hypothetical protein [Micrococcales bacterium]
MTAVPASAQPAASTVAAKPKPAPSQPAPKPTTAPKPTATPKPTTAPKPTPTPCPTESKPKCTIAPAITEFISPVAGNTYQNTPLSTAVQNGQAQVLVWNPVLWRPLFGISVAPPVTVKGTGQPGTQVTLYRVSGGGTALSCTATVSAAGKWSCDVPLSAFPTPQIQWEKGSVKTGWLWDGTGAYGAYQTIGIKSDCGLDGAHVKVVSGYTTPIAIDFSGAGRVETVSADQAPATFDFGQKVRSGWLAPSAGFLAWDRDGDGVISGIDELFGGGVGDGFARLAQFDTNGDGVVDAADAGYAQLSIWRDTNMNKITDPGELVSLADAGVVSLTVAHEDYWEFDAAGNAVYEHSFATLADGQRAAMNDVYFALA